MLNRVSSISFNFSLIFLYVQSRFFGFLKLSIEFLIFSLVFLWFSLVGHRFSYIFNRFSLLFFSCSSIFLYFQSILFDFHRFLFVFLWFSYVLQPSPRAPEKSRKPWIFGNWFRATQNARKFNILKRKSRPISFRFWWGWPREDGGRQNL